VGIFVFLFYDLNLSRTAEVARELKLIYLIPALACTTIWILLKTLRWVTIVGITRKLIFWPSLYLYSTAQVISVLLPALTGQAGRVLLFSKKGNFSKTYVFSTAILEIVLDGAGLISLMLLASTFFAFPEEYRFVSYIIAGATLLVLIIFYCSLNFQSKLESIGHRTLRRKSPKVYLIIRKFMRSFNEGISALRSTDKIFVMLAYTILSWIMHVGSVYFLFHAFNLDLPASAAMVVIIVNYLALMVPITPGNLGSFQLAVVAALNIFAVPKTEGVLFSVILYLIDMIPLLFFASFFVFKEQFSIFDFSDDEELIADVENLATEAEKPVEEKGGAR